MFRQVCRSGSSRVPRPDSVCGRFEGLQADFAPPLINAIAVFDETRALLSLIIPVKLCPIHLGSPLEGADSIEHHCHLPSRRVSRGDGLSQQFQTFPLKRGQADGMLRDQPCGLGAVVSDEPRRRPPDCGDDRLQLARVRLVHSLHLRMVAVEQAAVRREPLSRVEIIGRQGFELMRDDFVHIASLARVAAACRLTASRRASI